MIQDPKDWAVFQHPEGASDDDDVLSQGTDYWPLVLNEDSGSQDNAL